MENEHHHQITRELEVDVEERTIRIAGPPQLAAHRKWTQSPDCDRDCLFEQCGVQSGGGKGLGLHFGTLSPLPSSGSYGLQGEGRRMSDAKKL